MTHTAHAPYRPTENEAPHPPVWRAVGYVATSTEMIEATVTTLEDRLGAILSPPAPIASAPATPPSLESPLALELRELSGRLDRLRDRILTLLDRAEILTVARSSPDRSIPRAERIRKAILADLRDANEPRALSDLPRARAIARDARELYITAERLRVTGAIVRHGLGYHQGEPHRYELPKEKSA